MVDKMSMVDSKLKKMDRKIKKHEVEEEEEHHPKKKKKKKSVKKDQLIYRV